ncbi:hypothetical protein [Aquamicrobium terrae]|uniref:Uncharacterized protein n=1 Tax=Aquamicrobium terrae TaxID=1324945 RepID=A0ABV2MVR3_9HYPH
MATQNNLPPSSATAGPIRSVKMEAERLAADPRVTDYDFWRTLRNVDNCIFEIAARGQPIPFDMVRWRAILKQARSRRGHA